MIIARPVGGLANQMSVYAAARALAEHHRVPLKLDLAGLANDKLRCFELDKLCISADLATPEEIREVARQSSSPLVNKLKKKLRKKLGWHFGVYKERSLVFDGGFFDLPDSMYIWGNFMSIRYYEPIKEILNNEFQVSYPLSEATRSWQDRIQFCESVSLHIRRGDYANDPHTRAHHGLLGLDYYHKAIEVIKEKVSSPEIFVFSDDLLWVKEELKSDLPIHFVDANDSENGYQDYHLMLSCNHHIIANSGFSRWPAYLNQKASKVVCLPNAWLQKEHIGDADVAPPEWVRIIDDPI
ncbi:MAG: alpha-1,2-fucosyltransferase [Endozoicomonas sp.]